MWLFHYVDDEWKFDWFTKPPKYAILSHRWREPGEILFDDVSSMQNLPAHKMPGLRKIETLGRIALQHKVQAFWIDTCCIDKKSSEELGEAIRSMYRWYQQAKVCFAYLDDIECDPRLMQLVQEPGIAPEELKLRSERLFRRQDSKYSEWFQRAWTLQELIAPVEVIFFDRLWRPIGKRSELAAALAEISGIDEQLLVQDRQLKYFSVAQRMSWASNRVATRVEDRAYSLLGLFNVSMSTLYGEGRNAFERLQREIIAQSDDESIFAFTPQYEFGYDGDPLLASSPRDFAMAKDIVPLHDVRRSFRFTNLGLEIELALFHITCKCEETCWHHNGHAVRLNCGSLSDPTVVIALPLESLDKPSQQLWFVHHRRGPFFGRTLRLQRSQIPREYEVTPITLVHEVPDLDVIESRQERFFKIKVNCDIIEKLLSTYPSNLCGTPENLEPGLEKGRSILCVDMERLDIRVGDGELPKGYVRFLCVNGMQVVLYISRAGVYVAVIGENVEFTAQYPAAFNMKSAREDIMLQAHGLEVILSPRVENVLGIEERVHHLSVRPMGL